MRDGDERKEKAPEGGARDTIRPQSRRERRQQQQSQSQASR
jgi:hypothetical protein